MRSQRQIKYDIILNEDIVFCLAFDFRLLHLKIFHELSEGLPLANYTSIALTSAFVSWFD